MNNGLLTVVELARRTKVEPHVIRYYTQIGLLKPNKNGSNGYKFYNFKDEIRVRFTRKAKRLGYSLKEIQAILVHATQGESPCPMVREIIDRRLKETKEKIVELQELQSRMEKAIDKWNSTPNIEPNGDTICHLIEGFIED